MQRLTAVGFRPAGHWHLINDRLEMTLDPELKDERNVLYSFVSDCRVKYIGKTTRTLGVRMSNYRKPGARQTTNQGNHDQILALLRAGREVQILAWPDNGLMHIGTFHLNLAAGLEDSLIRVIDPAWNGGKKEVGESTVQAVQAQGSDDALVPLEEETSDDPGPSTFAFKAGETYRTRGFFNVPVVGDRGIGEHGQQVELHLGTGGQTLTGRIDRVDNKNGTARIKGGPELGAWIRASTELEQPVDVEVLSKLELKLVPRRPEQS